MSEDKTASIVLAAGCSRRMHSFKPFLMFGEHSALKMVINTQRDANIETIIVVTGHRGQEVADSLKGTGVLCVKNDNYLDGMYSSVLKGVRALRDGCGAFFVSPVDVPLIKSHTLSMMKEGRLAKGKGILYPVFAGRRGHPPLIDIKYKGAIQRNSGEGGLERVLQSFPEDSADVRVFDKAVLMDMDTENDYNRLLDYYRLEAPDGSECEAILDYFKVSEDIIRHSIKVAQVVRDILEHLGHHGHTLNAAALKAAALLHDIAKGKRDHSAEGARVLKRIGYEKVSYIMSTHMDLIINKENTIDENEILYLADKLVMGDSIMPLYERRCIYLKMFAGNAEAVGNINKRFDTAERIVKKIEKISGRCLKYV